MYFLAKQRDTIARTLEPTREQDSRNVLGPSKDHRPCCWVPVHGRRYSIKFSLRRYCGAKVHAGNLGVDAGRTWLGSPVYVLFKHDSESIRDCFSCGEIQSAYMCLSIHHIPKAQVSVTGVKSVQEELLLGQRGPFAIAITTSSKLWGSTADVTQSSFRIDFSRWC